MWQPATCLSHDPTACCSSRSVAHSTTPAQCPMQHYRLQASIAWDSQPRGQGAIAAHAAGACTVCCTCTAHSGKWSSPEKFRSRKYLELSRKGAELSRKGVKLTRSRGTRIAKDFPVQTPPTFFAMHTGKIVLGNYPLFFRDFSPLCTTFSNILATPPFPRVALHCYPGDACRVTYLITAL